MNPLTELIPAKYRKTVYAVVLLLALVFACWQAADGNWLQFAAGLLTALTSGLAHANTGTSVAGDAPR